MILSAHIIILTSPPFYGFMKQTLGKKVANQTNFAINKETKDQVPIVNQRIRRRSGRNGLIQKRQYPN